MRHIVTKYHNKKVTYFGKSFDSKREGNRYLYLLDRQHRGAIKDLILQPEFILQEAFEKDGIKYRPIIYIADFSYTETKTNKRIIEDAKGVKTDVFKIKKKLFEKRYTNLTIKEV